MIREYIYNKGVKEKVNKLIEERDILHCQQVLRSIFSSRMEYQESCTLYNMSDDDALPLSFSEANNVYHMYEEYRSTKGLSFYIKSRKQYFLYRDIYFGTVSGSGYTLKMLVSFSKKLSDFAW